MRSASPPRPRPTTRTQKWGGRGNRAVRSKGHREGDPSGVMQIRLGGGRVCVAYFHRLRPDVCFYKSPAKKKQQFAAPLAPQCSCAPPSAPFCPMDSRHSGQVQGCVHMRTAPPRLVQDNVQCAKSNSCRKGRHVHCKLCKVWGEYPTCRSNCPCRHRQEGVGGQAVIVCTSIHVLICTNNPPIPQGNRHVEHPEPRPMRALSRQAPLELSGGSPPDLLRPQGNH